MAKTATIGTSYNLHYGHVWPDAALTIAVRPFNYVMFGVPASYVGTTGFAITASQTNYVYLDDAGALQASIVSYPVSGAHIRLATVTADASTITGVTDDRCFLQTSQETSTGGAFGWLQQYPGIETRFNPDSGIDYPIPYCLATSSWDFGALAAASPLAIAFIIQRPCVVSNCYINVHSTAGGGSKLVKLAIYRSVTDGFYPGAFVGELGETSTASTGVKTLTPGAPISLSPGFYWMAWWCDHTSTNPQFKSTLYPIPLLGGDGSAFDIHTIAVTAALAYGAWPDPFPTEGTVLGGERTIAFLRFSSVS